MAEQNKTQSDLHKSSDHRQQAGLDRNQQKSDTQRQAEEAARRYKPKGGASSVGTVGT